MGFREKIKQFTARIAIGILFIIIALSINYLSINDRNGIKIQSVDVDDVDDDINGFKRFENVLNMNWIKATVIETINENEIKISYSLHPSSGLIGFKEEGIINGTLSDAMKYFHDGGITWETQWSPLIEYGEFIKIKYDNFSNAEMIVRTVYKLPWWTFLHKRQFVFKCIAKQIHVDTGYIIYVPLTKDEKEKYKDFYHKLDEKIATHADVLVSGQKITAFKNGKFKWEHHMFHTFNGWITPWIQNTFFFNGNKQAYFDEFPVKIPR
eukprot:272989_1